MIKTRHVGVNNPLHRFDLNPVYLHGIKTPSGISDMRKYLLDGRVERLIPERITSSRNNLDSRWTLR